MNNLKKRDLTKREFLVISSIVFGLLIGFALFSGLLILICFNFWVETIFYLIIIIISLLSGYIYIIGLLFWTDDEKNNQVEEE